MDFFQMRKSFANIISIIDRDNLFGIFSLKLGPGMTILQSKANVVVKSFARSKSTFPHILHFMFAVSHFTCLH